MTKQHAPALQNHVNKIRGSLQTICTDCGYSIAPIDLERLDNERVRCPACGREFVPPPKVRQALKLAQFFCRILVLLVALIVAAWAFDGRILHHSLEHVGQFPLGMERASYFAPLKPPCCDSVQAVQIPIILPNKSRVVFTAVQDPVLTASSSAMSACSNC